MNGKQAKRLRRAAIGLAATLSEAGREIKKDGYEVKMHDNRLSAFSTVFDPKGVLPKEAVEDPNVKFEVPPSLQFSVRKDSLKGIYRTLKSGKA